MAINPGILEKKIKDILLNTQESTWVLAHKLGMRNETPKMLTIMKIMEQRGIVKRHRFSCKNNIVWELCTARGK